MSAKTIGFNLREKVRVAMEIINEGSVPRTGCKNFETCSIKSAEICGTTSICTLCSVRR